MHFLKIPSVPNRYGNEELHSWPCCAHLCRYDFYVRVLLEYCGFAHQHDLTVPRCRAHVLLMGATESTTLFDRASDCSVYRCCVRQSVTVLEINEHLRYWRGTCRTRVLGVVAEEVDCTVKIVFCLAILE